LYTPFTLRLTATGLFNSSFFATDTTFEGNNRGATPIGRTYALSCRSA
jgi:hypothetical protein